MSEKCARIMSGQSFLSSEKRQVRGQCACVCLYVCAQRSGNVRDSFERARWVGVGMAVIFLVKAQALNFQIAPANKCRVDKRGKTMPTWELGKQVG